MKAVILAAGTAKRLGALTQEIPKCLLRVGPCTIIEHQLAALEARGIAPIIVVTGHGAAHLHRQLGERVRYVHNERYDETNSMYSMWLARDAAAGGFVLLNSDVLLHPELLDRLLDSPYPDALLVDFREDLGDPELMRVRVAGDRLMEISKEIPPGQAQGENVGVLKFGAEGARRLFAKADELVGAGVEHRWAPYVYNAIAADHVLRTIPTGGLPWIEIDFPEDLTRAEHEVLPHLQGVKGTAPMPEDKRVDQEWKDKVQREKEGANAEGRMPNAEGKEQPPASPETEPKKRPPLADKLETPEAKFTFLVSSLASQALINLGLIENPVSRKNEVDLGGAKFAIDLIQMLADKTRGNLADVEKRYLDGVLYDLRMRFVEARK